MVAVQTQYSSKHFRAYFRNFPGSAVQNSVCTVSVHCEAAGIRSTAAFGGESRHNTNKKAFAITETEHVQPGYYFPIKCFLYHYNEFSR